MYRESEYSCVGCRRWLSPHQCDFDGEGRPVCAHCHALAEVDLALARWRQDARADRYLRRIAGVTVVPLVILLLAIG